MPAKTQDAKPSKRSHQELEQRPATGHVVVAEDDDEMRSLVALSLQYDGHDVVECRDGVELLSHLQQVTDSQQDKTQDNIDLVIADVRMPGASGLAVLERLSHQPESPPVILITAFGDSETHNEARRLGAVACLDKPFDMEELLGHVHSVMPRARPDP